MNANTKGIAPEITMPVIDDGLEAIEVKNTHGLTIGTWLFNPSDVGIIDRYNAALPKFESIFEPLQDANISVEGEGEDDASWALVTAAKEKLFDACAEVFGPTFKDAFFSTTHPFSPVKGHFYVENVLDYARKVIEIRMDTELKGIDKNVEKYTAAYAKKKAQYEKSKPKVVKAKEADDE